MRQPALLCSSLLFLFIFSMPSLGQNSQSYLNDLGSTPYGVNIPVENGFINISNGNLHLEFPLASHPQRGALALNERITYDSRIWMFSPFGSHGSYHWWPYNVPGSSTTSDGWRFISGLETGTVSYQYAADVSKPVFCQDSGYSGMDQEYVMQLIWTDPSGTVHPFNAGYTSVYDPCTGSNTLTNPYYGGAEDGSGYNSADDGSGNPKITDNSGTEVYPQIIDRYGNYWSNDGQGNLKDDTGRVPVVVTQNGNVTYYDVLAPNGTPDANNQKRVRYTVTIASIPVATNFRSFADSDIYPWNPSVQYLTPVQSILLPDGSQYTFGYDSTGELNSVTLPTGGVIQYGYSNFLDSSNTENRWLTSRTVGSNPAMTVTPTVSTTCANYSAGCVEQINLHKPSGDETVYQLTLNNGAWNTGVTTYTGLAANGQKLSQTTNSNTYTNGCVSFYPCSGANYLSQTLATTARFKNPATSAVYMQTLSSFMFSVGKINDVKEWDYVSSSPSTTTPPTTPPARETVYTYTNSDDPYQVSILDSGGNQVGLTTYGYTTTATATSNLPQHGTQNAGGPYLQTVSQWLNTGGTLDQTMSYDDAGTLLSSTDPNGTTTYGHDATDTFVTSTTLPTPSSGVSLTTSATFDVVSGVPLTQTGVNGTKTLFVSYDVMNRPTEIDTQDSGGNLVGKRTSMYYSPTNSGFREYQSATAYADVEVEHDIFGRLSRTATYNGQSGNAWYQQDTCYDSNGRVSFQSTPYQGSGWGVAKVCSGAGTATTYDGLNRTATISNADGTSQATYAGRATKAVDVNNVTTISQSDALGRISAVCEISSGSNMLGSGSPVDCGLDISGTGFLTNYAYDLASHATTITQGVQQRTFQADSLGRTTNTTEPERGHTGYTYTYNGTGLVVTRTRPRANQTGTQTTTTTTQYDSLGRVISIGYNDGLTPNKFFAYDQAAGWAEGQTGVKGMLSYAHSSVSPNWAGSIFSYDAMGRPTQMYQCLPSGCGNAATDMSLNTGYDLAGNQTSLSTSIGTLTYGRSAAGEVTSITSSYQNGNNPGTLVSNVVNGPNGPISYSLGNGLSSYRAYDVSGRPSLNWVCQGAASFNCNTQIFGNGGYWGSGRIAASDDTVMNAHGSYSYDEFNRLSAMTFAFANNTQQTFNYVYDRWGNRWQQNAPQGGPSPNLTFNTSNNQIIGLPYDAAGNLMNDGNGNGYTYDAEGNVLTMSGNTNAQYGYDALNHRVRAQVGNAVTEYAYDQAGRRILTYLPGQGIAEQQHYWDNRQFAYWAGDGTTYFEHQDWLGTERMRTNHSGAVASTYGSLPFGDGGPAVPSGYGSDQETLHFAGLDKDSATTDHATFRQYANTQGRWMSPDPYDGSMDLGNPQTLNRYSYVLNSPLLYTDPTGQFPIACGFGGKVADGVLTVGFGVGIGEIAAVAGAVGCAAAGIYEIIHLFDHPKFHGSTTPRPNAHIWDEHEFSYGANPGGALGLPGGGCDFGACGAGGYGFQNTPVSGPWHYGNWCGAGGMGKPINGVDDFCMWHDLRFGKTGADWTNMQSEANWNKLRPDQQNKVQEYNQQLCDGMSSILPTIPWWNLSESIAAKEINVFFHKYVPKGARCH